MSWLGDHEKPKSVIPPYRTSRWPNDHTKVDDGFKDAINPSHYRKGGVETIDFIEAKKLNFNRGNVVKYTTRAGSKYDELEDLDKAEWYIQREKARIRNAISTNTAT